MAVGSGTSSRPSSEERPEFAVVLGLLPPYTLEDAKRAFLAKVKDAHPDRGGDRAEFDRLQQAHAQAVEFLRFRSDRRQWIAKQMDQYVATLALVDQLSTLGAEVETRTLDWLKRSFGEFADLSESIVAVEATGSMQVGAILEALVAEQTTLSGLKRINFARSVLGDKEALELRFFPGLTHLDLSHTQVTDQVLQLVDWLPELEELQIEGTGLGYFARRRLRRILANREKARPAAVFHPTNIR